MDERAKPLRVLGIVGSLRQGSYNRQLMRAARGLAPESLRIEMHGLGELPLYDADLDADDRRPAPVERLKQAIDAADALLVATPEYNHTVPGVLQNAIDWASRPSMKSPLAGKPTGIMGASLGAIGAARAQQHLKLTLMSTLAYVLPHPGVSVGQAREKFDAEGRLIHEPTQQFLAAFLRELESWTRRFVRRDAHARHAA